MRLSVKRSTSEGQKSNHGVEQIWVGLHGGVKVQQFRVCPTVKRVGQSFDPGHSYDCKVHGNDTPNQLPAD